MILTKTGTLNFLMHLIRTILMYFPPGKALKCIRRVYNSCENSCLTGKMVESIPFIFMILLIKVEKKFRCYVKTVLVTTAVLNNDLKKGFAENISHKGAETVKNMLRRVAVLVEVPHEVFRSGRLQHDGQRWRCELCWMN